MFLLFIFLEKEKGAETCYPPLDNCFGAFAVF